MVKDVYAVVLCRVNRKDLHDICAVVYRTSRLKRTYLYSAMKISKSVK